MTSFRSSTDNFSGDTLTNAEDTSTPSSSSSTSSTLTSTPPLNQGDTSTSTTTHIGDDEEPPTPLPIHTLSQPSDWARLLHSILFAHGQNSVLACLSVLYIIARLPLAGWSMYQIYRSAIGSTVGGIVVLIVVFLMWIMEREIGLEKKCWDVLVGMGKVWIREERGGRERWRRWRDRERKQQKREKEADGWDWEGGDENGSLEAWMGETSTLRDHDRSFYEGGESDTIKLL